MPDCLRCSSPKPASFLIEFTYEGDIFEMELCSKHSLMFDRSMEHWTAVAHPVVNPAQRVPVGVTNGGIQVVSPASGRIRGEISEDAMAYTFTEHALHRMAKRKITKQDVLAALSTKSKTVTSGQNSQWPDAEVWLCDDIKAVVNPKRHRVISVMWRWEEMAAAKQAEAGTR